MLAATHEVETPVLGGAGLVLVAAALVLSKEVELQLLRHVGKPMGHQRKLLRVWTCTRRRRVEGVLPGPAKKTAFELLAG